MPVIGTNVGLPSKHMQLGLPLADKTRGGRLAANDPQQRVSWQQNRIRYGVQTGINFQASLCSCLRSQLSSAPPALLPAEQAWRSPESYAGQLLGPLEASANQQKRDTVHCPFSFSTAFLECAISRDFRCASYWSTLTRIFAGGPERADRAGQLVSSRLRSVFSLGGRKLNVSCQNPAARRAGAASSSAIGVRSCEKHSCWLHLARSLPSLRMAFVSLSRV